jgi:hypothetical protein
MNFAGIAQTPVVRQTANSRQVRQQVKWTLASRTPFEGRYIVVDLPIPDESARKQHAVRVISPDGSASSGPNPFRRGSGVPVPGELDCTLFEGTLVP